MVAHIRGPMVWIALSVFILGSAIQILQFFWLSRKTARSFAVYDPDRENRAGKLSLHQRISDMAHYFGRTVFVTYPLTMTVSTVFHVCLIFLPLFVLGHTELIALSIGHRLPSFPERLSDGLTLIVLLCCTYFFIRRVALARMRAISSVADYLVLALVGVSFLSGYLAYHQIFDYQSTITIHMLSGELMLMAIPFTKMAHMTFFFFNRFMVIHEHTLGRGERVW